MRRLEDLHVQRAQRFRRRRGKVAQHHDDAIAAPHELAHQRKHLHQVPEPTAEFPHEQDCGHDVTLHHGGYKKRPPVYLGSTYSRMFSFRRSIMSQ